MANNDPMGLAAGFGAAGAASGLQELLANRFMRDKLAAAERAQQTQEQQAQQRLDLLASGQQADQALANRQLMQRNLDTITAGAQHRQEFNTETGLRKQQLDQAAREADVRTSLENERLGMEAQQQANAERHARTAEAQGWAHVDIARKNAGQKEDDAAAVADAIQRGEQPPDLSRMYGMAGPIRSKLAKSGYNLTQASEDWNATQKYLATLNGAQQVRLRQAVDFTTESLGKVEELAQQWKSAGMGPLSRANLALAAQGAQGPQAQSLATRFQSQIADVTSELGTVYKGGNSSTDESLALAAKNLQADWSEKALLDNVAQIRQNLGYRRNSMRTAGVAGASATNPYTPGAAGTGSTTTSSAPAAATAASGTRPKYELIP